MQGTVLPIDNYLVFVSWHVPLHTLKSHTLHDLLDTNQTSLTDTMGLEIDLTFVSALTKWNPWELTPNLTGTRDLLPSLPLAFACTQPLGSIEYWYHLSGLLIILLPCFGGCRDRMWLHSKANANNVQGTSCIDAVCKRVSNSLGQLFMLQCIINKAFTNRKFIYTIQHYGHEECDWWWCPSDA